MATGQPLTLDLSSLICEVGIGTLQPVSFFISDGGVSSGSTSSPSGLCQGLPRPPTALQDRLCHHDSLVLSLETIHGSGVSFTHSFVQSFNKHSTSAHSRLGPVPVPSSWSWWLGTGDSGHLQLTWKPGWASWRMCHLTPEQPAGRATRGQVPQAGERAQAQTLWSARGSAVT